jgi:hypothetical protein
MEEQALARKAWGDGYEAPMIEKFLARAVGSTARSVDHLR